MGYFHFHTINRLKAKLINRLKAKLSQRTRAERFRQFEQTMNIKGGVRIVDPGGASEFWDGIDTPLSLTIMNLPGFNPPYDGSSHHEITLLECDACETKFPDQSFDIAFSNSVIEHVDGAVNEDRLASEVQRLAPAYWVADTIYLVSD
jgi:hypothetical protein